MTEPNPASTLDLFSLAAECRELLELAEKATAGEWTSSAWGPYPDCVQLYSEAIHPPLLGEMKRYIGRLPITTSPPVHEEDTMGERNAAFIARSRTAAPSIAEKCLRVISEITEMRAEIAERTRDHEELWTKFREREAERVALLAVAKAAKEMKEAGLATSRSMAAIGQIWDALAALPPHLLDEVKEAKS